MSEATTVRTIVLLGMMGSGKTTVGQVLARRLGWPYLDNDELVRRVTGREPRDIDATDGEARLHQAEADALHHALSMPGPLVAAAAAWVVAEPSCVAALHRCPAVVYLRATPQTLRARIGAGAGRRQDATDLDWLRARFAERDELYRSMASVVVDTDERRPDEVAAAIIEALRLNGEAEDGKAGSPARG